MSTQYRRERISELLLSFVGGELRGMRDPRLALVTLTGIDVSKDYRYAKIFWSGLPQQTIEDAEENASSTSESPAGSFMSADAVQETQKALDGVRGLLKKRIGAELELKFIPHLQFEYDDSGENASRIDQLLREAGLFRNPGS